MPVVVGIQFKPVTKLYHFSPGAMLDLGANEFVIVDTSKGQEVAQIVLPPHAINETEVVGEMKSVVRRATSWDLVQKDLWEHKEQEALTICRAKARESHLDIKMVRCEYNFDGGKLLIYFSSEDRVDFRNLVRDLARIFRTRIEMRQIGVRDEAKLLDGVGKCGRQLCCTSWLREFTPVSIRMAKNQQLPLNPEEISGVCGRLLCCLSYEDAHYKEQNKKMPKLGAEVVTPQGGGRVRHLHPLKESVTVMLESGVLTEFTIADLVTSKSAGGSCGTCGGCTVKRRASAEEDNARVRQARDEQKAGEQRGSEQRGSEQRGGRRAAGAENRPPQDDTRAGDDGGDSSKKRRRRRRRSSGTGKPDTVD
ncbi:MAG: stage 0 sporulation family protein [Litorilinea sp.]